jgi:hypothetical protein
VQARWRWLVALLVVMMTVAFAASREGPMRVVPIGDPVTVGDLTVTVQYVVDPLEPTGEDFHLPAPGTRWVAVDLEVTLDGADPLLIAPARQFELEDSDGSKHAPVTTDHALPSLEGPIEPDTIRRGTIVFQAPLAARGLRLLFREEPSASPAFAVDLDT